MEDPRKELERLLVWHKARRDAIERLNSLSEEATEREVEACMVEMTARRFGEQYTKVLQMMKGGA